MNLPHSTYRLQFRNGVDFDRAAGLVPYFARLGVSHLYASPLFQAVPGSTHGYDVTDYSRFDDSLGGLGGFLRLSTALQAHGLGLILDIVPNHMAASVHSPWWRDVLRHGQASAHARHFDIDWTRPKLILPVLGQAYGSALDAGEFVLGHDPEGLTWRYLDHAFPLDPRTWPLMLGTADPPVSEVSVSDPAAFARWRADEANAARLTAHLEAISRDTARLHRIHEAQSWRLVYWRAARDMLSYRRFFEISDLVGVRVEEPQVFDDVHRFLFEIIDAGHVDGVRVDHVDGLADPAGYLDRLKRNAPRAIPIWVEKILARDEHLPPDWQVAGTTGYELADAVGRALTNAAAEPVLDRAYAAFAGEAHNYDGMLNAAKREILSRNLAAELATLARLATDALASDLTGRDWGPDTLRRAITALMCAMPVYRTYLRAPGGSRRDRELLARVVDKARADRDLDDPMSVDAVAGCLVDGEGDTAAVFRTRFQQTSGALMAKAVEDTLFYRFNRLISANEVGVELRSLGSTPEEFHIRMSDRAASQPAGLSATATHDTKRGEDARMRIAAISEAPEMWAAAVDHFDALLTRNADVPMLDADTRWLFYQALLGAWHPSTPDDLRARMSLFLLKAARESQVRTSWVKQDANYENCLAGFVEHALQCRPFLDAFGATASGYIRIGERKGLVQLAFKLTLPGIPDIYQGSELADLSFVDPDNRRPVDFDRRRRLIERDEAKAADDFDERKMTLVRFGLGLRREHPDVFAGGYRPLPVPDGSGARTLAFAREGRSALLVVAADLSGEGDATVGSEPLWWPSIGEGYRLTRSFPAAPLNVPPADHDVGPHLRVTGVSISLFKAN